MPVDASSMQIVIASIVMIDVYNLYNPAASVDVQFSSPCARLGMAFSVHLSVWLLYWLFDTGCT